MSKQEIEKQIAIWEIKHAVRVENLGPNSNEAQEALGKICDLNRAWLELDEQAGA